MSRHLTWLIGLLGILLLTVVGCDGPQDDDSTAGDDDDSVDDDDSAADDDDSAADDDDSAADDDDTSPPCTDDDGDGWCVEDGDCDDADATVHPGAPEVCDSHDNDCGGAAELEVPAGYASITAAIDAASDGDIVCVAPGHYVETIDFGGKEITVLGYGGRASTVIDGGGFGPVVTFQSSEDSDSVLRGLTLTGGFAVDGGGLFLDHASPTLADLVIEGNTAEDIGGGVYMFGSSPLLTDVIVRDNETEWGGGLFLEYGWPELYNVVVSNNHASMRGGGLFMADNGGQFEYLIVSGNTADDAGGGIMMLYADPTIANSVIVGNTTDGAGGGICAADAGPILVNTVIAYNTAGPHGGGVDVALYEHPDEPEPTYCDFFGNTPDDYYYHDGIIPIGTLGNVSVDPEFLDTTDPDPGSWDLHLSVASPLIDAGDPALLDPDGSISDMGCYAGPSAASWDLDQDGYDEWWLPGAYDAATSPGMDCDDDDPLVYPGNGC